MLATRRVTALTMAMALIAGCSPADDFVSNDRTGSGLGARDSVGDAAADPNPTAPPPSNVEQAADPVTQDTASAAAEPPIDVGPGMFTDDGATEFAVSVLRSRSDVDGDSASPVGVAVSLANRDAASVGLPFEPGGPFSAPIAFGDSDDLTSESEPVPGGIDDLLVAESDLFIGAVPEALVAATTELAASRGVPLVVVNHIATGAGEGDRRGTRLDLGGSIDLELRAVVAAVVAGEHDGIVVVGSPTDPGTARTEQLLLEVGADPVVIDATEPPSPTVLDAALAQISTVGERPAVLLVSDTWATPVIDTLLAAGSEAQFFGSDLSLSEGDVAALASFASNQLVVVRRVEDLRRPEVAEFAALVIDGQVEDASNRFAAVSYDAYALAAIATVSLGSADGATIRRGMIEASRVGEPCDRLSDCLALAANGIDVDYEGVSGPLDLDDDGVATAMWLSVDIIDPVTRGVATTDLVLQRR